MDISSTYLGLQLRTPLVASASPLSEELDNIRRLEDAGISAVVLHSLFEEQLTREMYDLHQHLSQGTESYPEALSYFPEPIDYHLGPEAYLNHIRRAKEAVRIPIIASLNGQSLGSWVKYAAQIQQAGADALELNIYSIPSDFDLSPAAIEDHYAGIVSAVRAEVTIPLAVKLSPFHSNLGHTARRLVGAGANGLVLFNRFYQPDIDLETLDVRPQVLLSTPFALRLPMRWIAILSGRLPADLAATSGIHTHHDILKMLMVGAHTTMLCSVLLKRGIEHVRALEHDLTDWLYRHEYHSIDQLRGSMNQINCPDPSAFERAQYMRALTGYRTYHWPADS